MAPSLGREVETMRWLRCMIWQTSVSTTLWFFWQIVFYRKSESSYFRFLPSVWTLARFLTFQASQLLFLVGNFFVTSCQEKEVASLVDLVSGVWKLGCNLVVGSSWEPGAARQLSLKISATRDQIIFTFLCGISGFLSLMALASAQLEPSGTVDIGIRGAALGLGYACLHFYQKKGVLSFPIIQRNFYYSLKMGSSQVLMTSMKLTVIVPVSEIFVGVFGGERKHSVHEILASGFSSFLWHQIVFVCGAICTTVCWELCHHLIQVIQTRRHVFAPPLGSAAAETQPSEQLLLTLEEADNRSLIQHLAYLDACIVAESNVDTWRRTALFEESGETYKRVIDACLGPLDNLTMRLVKGLEIFESKSGDFLKQQMQLPGLDKKFEGGSIKEIFKDSQICAWCARTAASLTASSRLEDRYGVAQLSGCNKSVLSSLLSCLLVVEVYLGRRSNAKGGGGFVGPNSIKWTVPSQGPVAEVTRRKGFPFGKGSVMHKKAYALADVLRTSVYQITAAFGEEMVVGSVGGKGVTIAERDWLNEKPPLYGTHEMHLQKLSLFLEYRVS